MVKNEELEAARIRAYRQARVFEPSMDGYYGAMATYTAAFGKPDGEIGVMLPDGSERQPWELGRRSSSIVEKVNKVKARIAACHQEIAAIEEDIASALQMLESATAVDAVDPSGRSEGTPTTRV